MRFSTLTLASFGVAGTSAAGLWGVFSSSSSRIMVGGGDDAVEGFPAFLGFCDVALFPTCFNIDGNSSISITSDGSYGWIFTQSADGLTAHAHLDAWPSSSTVKQWLTPALG
ncbi:hypothetical protein F4777DRAFT_436398 [Nemania sp. FL0916]|nr:hypothetical protein F4777DRAFT_436398 [Nemania sp. FL0916]